MSELNRENIIIALECCSFCECDFRECPYYKIGNCVETLHKDAFALLNELIKENDRLNLSLSATIERSENRKEADISEILELRLEVDELSKENERLIDK